MYWWYQEGDCDEVEGGHSSCPSETATEGSAVSGIGGTVKGFVGSGDPTSTDEPIIQHTNMNALATTDERTRVEAATYASTCDHGGSEKNEGRAGSCHPPFKRIMTEGGHCDYIRRKRNCNGQACSKHRTNTLTLKLEQTRALATILEQT